MGLALLGVCEYICQRVSREGPNSKSVRIKNRS